jgi:cytochrome c553
LNVPEGANVSEHETGGAVMKLSLIWVMLPLFFYASAAVLAADVDAGKRKARECMSCHGAKLDSYEEADFRKRLNAIRDGTVHSPIMVPIAKNITDEDVDNLAAYFKSRKK